MTTRIDITREYRELIEALLVLGSGREKSYLEANWHNPVMNAESTDWHRSIETYRSLQYRVFSEDTRNMSFTYQQEIHLTFSLNPVQQKVFAAETLTLETPLPQFVVDPGNTPVLDYEPSFIASGEFRIPVSFKFNLSVECERYLFEMGLHNIEGPLRRRYYRLSSEHDKWRESSSIGEIFYNEPYHFDFDEETLDLLPESLFEATLVLGE